MHRCLTLYQYIHVVDMCHTDIHMVDIHYINIQIVDELVVCTLYSTHYTLHIRPIPYILTPEHSTVSAQP